MQNVNIKALPHVQFIPNLIFSPVHILLRLPDAEVKHPPMLPLLQEPVAPAAAGDFQPPNDCFSPQGSVEAQCGLVLNGQGGVIRRGRPPVCLSSVLAPEAVNARRLDTTRQDSKLQADKQAERSSVVCCQHFRAGTDTLSRTFLMRFFF